MTILELSKKIPLHHDFIDKWDVEFGEEDWVIEGNSLVLDLAKIRRKLCDTC